MDPNQIIQMLQARGMQLPPNALQFLQNWQQNRPVNSPNWQPGQFLQNNPNTFQNLAARMGPFANPGQQFNPVMPPNTGAPSYNPPLANKGGGVGRTMTGNNPSFAPAIY